MDNDNITANGFSGNNVIQISSTIEDAKITDMSLPLMPEMSVSYDEMAPALIENAQLQPMDQPEQEQEPSIQQEENSIFEDKPVEIPQEPAFIDTPINQPETTSDTTIEAYTYVPQEESEPMEEPTSTPPMEQEETTEEQTIIEEYTEEHPPPVQEPEQQQEQPPEEIQESIDAPQQTEAVEDGSKTINMPVEQNVENTVLEQPQQDAPPAASTQQQEREYTEPILDKSNDFENSTVVAEDIAKIERGESEAGGFSGIVYVNGTKVVLSSETEHDWVKVDVSASTAAYNAGPAPSPFPDAEEWFELANTYGDIHVDRL